MDKDKEREDLRDLTPDKDAKGGIRAADIDERPKKPGIHPVPVPPIPGADTDPYTKT